MAAEQNVAALAPLVRRNWDVVVIEPSDAVMFQYDYPDLLPGNDRSVPTGTVAAGESGEQPAADGGTTDVEAVAKNTYGIMEYLDRYRLDQNLPTSNRNQSLTYHGHCHQKATSKDHHAVGVLRRSGYEVDPLDSGCCGMAGSFGYEAEHHSMSRAIAEIFFEQVEASEGDRIVAPGASCRSQLGERKADEPPILSRRLPRHLRGKRSWLDSYTTEQARIACQGVGSGRMSSSSMVDAKE